MGNILKQIQPVEVRLTTKRGFVYLVAAGGITFTADRENFVGVVVP